MPECVSPWIKVPCNSLYSSKVHALATFLDKPLYEAYGLAHGALSLATGLSLSAIELETLERRLDWRGRPGLVVEGLRHVGILADSPGPDGETLITPAALGPVQA